MDFSDALKELKAGRKVSRAGWNGKGMYLLHADYGTFSSMTAGVTDIEGDLEPHIVMFTADRKFVPWLASQTDILATDWGVV